MPIYSENEAEVEDRLASVFAGAAATASLAASAAASLKANPQEKLPPRLNAALSSMLRVVESVAALDVSTLLEQTPDHVPFPEELVAKLAQPPTELEDEVDATDRLKLVLADLRALLESPSSDVADRVEQFLGALSEAENAQAQALARGPLELESFVSPSPT
jgi:hypothetical protein